MPDKSSSPVRTGKYGVYEWLVSESYLEDLLISCSDSVVGKYVAVTSFDSGVFHPTAEEFAAGWELRNKIAYSPKIRRVENLYPGGWDEWFVFDNPTDLGGMAPQDSNPFAVPLASGTVHAFVNSNINVDPDADGGASYFWTQFSWIQPRTYIAENDYFLTFITADEQLFARAHAVIAALANESQP